MSDFILGLESTSPVRMSLQPMLERVTSGVESKKAVFSTSSVIGENEAVSLIGIYDIFDINCCWKNICLLSERLL